MQMAKAVKRKGKKEEKIEEIPFTVSLKHIFKKPKKKRAVSAVNSLRALCAKRMHFSSGNILLSGAVNSLLWARGRESVPRKIKLKAVKDGEKLRVFLPEEKFSPEKEKKKEEKKEKKKEEGKEKKESAEKEEEIERKKKEKKEKEIAAEKAAMKRKVS